MREEEEPRDWEGPHETRKWALLAQIVGIFKTWVVCEMAHGVGRIKAKCWHSRNRHFFVLIGGIKGRIFDFQNSYKI